MLVCIPPVLYNSLRLLLPADFGHMSATRRRDSGYGGYGGRGVVFFDPTDFSHCVEASVTQSTLLISCCVLRFHTFAGATAAMVATAAVVLCSLTPQTSC